MALEPRFVEPQSRWVIKKMGGRYDAFHPSARMKTNWMVLGGDVVLLWILLTIIF